MEQITRTEFELCIQIKGATKECPVLKDLVDFAAHTKQENDKHYMPELIIMGIDMGSDYSDDFGVPVFNGNNMSVRMLIGHDLAQKIIKLLQDESKPQG